MTHATRSGSGLLTASGVFLLLFRGTAAAQCAMCGTSIQTPDDPLGRGIFWSVLFLISLPYAIVGAFIVAIAWAYRRSKPSSRGAHLRPIAGGLEGRGKT